MSEDTQLTLKEALGLAVQLIQPVDIAELNQINYKNIQAKIMFNLFEYAFDIQERFKKEQQRP